MLQEYALRLLKLVLTDDSLEAPSAVLLPRLFAAAASNAKPVRAQALDCLVQAASDPQLAARLVTAERLGAAPLQAFLSGVVEHHAAVLDDGLGFEQVVKRLLPDDSLKSR